MIRHLVLVLGDQLDGYSAAFDGFDAERDVILQMELREEATYVPQHKRRIALFFSAMRHFRDAERARGRRVIYSELDDPANRGDFADELQRHINSLKPERVIVLEPGDWRVCQMLETTATPIEFREDRHFLCDRTAFDDFADRHRTLLLETFYRFMRRELGILIDKKGDPVGGAWNFDSDNRASFGRSGPPEIPPHPTFTLDATTKAVLRMVEREFADSPGLLDDFDCAVTREQALASLGDFVAHRLPDFGRYQDAMRSDEPILFHSNLSAAMNLHVLTPREVVDRVLENPADAPLNSVEGFVRQVIGWREFVRGIYWRSMPDYAELNVLRAELPMPRFYWTGETDMRCLEQAIGHTIRRGYAHHIERLMVLGLFPLLLGVRPYEVHRWHMSMFVDAIDWVSLPNTLGMSQHGDGGIVGTKPYVASGNYIDRMSDHCRHCRYDPHQSVGDNACPFTTLYWDFLQRHETRFAKNPRMRNQYANLRRKDAGELVQIRRRAEELKVRLTAETFL